MARYQIGDNVLAALIKQESGGDRNAISPKGARGLTQIMPATAQNPGYGVKPLQDNSEAEQTRFTRDYMGALLENNGGDLNKALAAYNAGQGNVDKYGGVPPFKETQGYVKNILNSINPVGEAQAGEVPQVKLPPGFVLDKPMQPPPGFVLDTETQPAQYEGRNIKDMSGASKFLIGAGNTAMNLGRGSMQATGLAGETGFGSQQDIEQSRKLTSELDKSDAGYAGNLFGSIAPAAMTGGASLPAIIGTGAALGALQPTLGDESRPKNILYGVGGGLIGKGLASGVGKLVKGFTPSKDAAALMKLSIQPTVGQGIEQGMVGKGIRKLEEASTALPIIGVIPQWARDRAKKEFTQAVLKEAENPALGISAKGQTGHEGIANLSDSIGKAYGDLYKNKTVSIPATLGADIEAKINNPERLLNYDERSKILNSVGSVLRKAVPDETGKYNAEDLHFIQSHLGELAAGQKGDTRKILFDVQKELRGALNEGLPQADQGKVKLLNEANTKYKRLEKAANTVGAPGGEFTPAQLYNAVKQTDISKGKAAFSKNRAIMQQIAGQGKNVLSDKLGESGTAPRMLLNSLLAGGEGIVAYTNPIPSLLAGSTMFAGATRPVQKALLGGYAGQKALSRGVNRLSPLLGATGANVAVKSQRKGK